MTTGDMEKLAKEVSVWLSSSEAQERLNEAHEQAEKTSEYLREASRIDPDNLNKPFTV
jgi:hypothetical protein